MTRTARAENKDARAHEPPALGLLLGRGARTKLPSPRGYEGSKLWNQMMMPGARWSIARYVSSRFSQRPPGRECRRMPSSALARLPRPPAYAPSLVIAMGRRAHLVRGLQRLWPERHQRGGASVWSHFAVRTASNWRQLTRFGCCGSLEPVLRETVTLEPRASLSTRSSSTHQDLHLPHRG